MAWQKESRRGEPDLWVRDTARGTAYVERRGRQSWYWQTQQDGQTDEWGLSAARWMAQDAADEALRRLPATGLDGVRRRSRCSCSRR